MGGKLCVPDIKENPNGFFIDQSQNCILLQNSNVNWTLHYHCNDSIYSVLCAMLKRNILVQLDIVCVVRANSISEFSETCLT